MATPPVVFTFTPSATDLNNVNVFFPGTTANPSAFRVVLYDAPSASGGVGNTDLFAQYILWVTNSANQATAYQKNTMTNYSGYAIRYICNISGATPY